MHLISKFSACLFLLCLASGTLFAQRQREALDRGVVAIHQPDGKVFVSWRLLASDPDGIAFNVYRSTEGAVQGARGGGAPAGPALLNPTPLTGPTWLSDSSANLSRATRYSVHAVINGVEQPSDGGFSLPAGAPPLPYLSIPLQTPEGYTPNDASAADLDGDGNYEIILHQVGRGADNAFSGLTTEPIFQAYKLDGTLLWTINLGKNIREGAHYTQFMVYDLDGDGRAEFVAKTADGTVDGEGRVIGDAQADWRETEGHVPSRDRTGSQTLEDGTRVAPLAGRILSGPEFLTVFEGRTGRALATVDYVPALGDVNAWGDAYGNRSERYLAAVAYLDGERPSVVMARGYYSRTTLAAWDWRDGKLTLRWLFDSSTSEENARFANQGNHGIGVADVDADGRDEIVYGGAVFDDNGKGLYSTGLGHGDAQHTSDLMPDRPGLETFSIHENPRHAHGTELRDTRTGEILWSKQSPDVGRGLAADIDPRHAGAETWASGQGLNGLWNVRGEVISERKPRSANFAVWWDGDLLRELLNSNSISKWDWENSTEHVLLTAQGASSNNGSKSTPTLSADLIGDWREEVIWRSLANDELRIYTTTIPTPYRLTTLMHDPQYRLGVAWQNVAYNQPPHPGFFLGDGMNVPTGNSTPTLPSR